MKKKASVQVLTYLIEQEVADEALFLEIVVLPPPKTLGRVLLACHAKNSAEHVMTYRMTYRSR